MQMIKFSDWRYSVQQRRWTFEDRYMLRLLWRRGQTLAAIAARLNRTPESVRTKARKIGLKPEMRHAA
jgi:IS30 family transposase